MLTLNVPDCFSRNFNFDCYFRYGSDTAILQVLFDIMVSDLNKLMYGLPNHMIGRKWTIESDKKDKCLIVELSGYIQFDVRSGSAFSPSSCLYDYTIIVTSVVKGQERIGFIKCPKKTMFMNKFVAFMMDYIKQFNFIDY